MEWGFY